MRSLRGKEDELMSALYLQVSIISQALIFVTRSRSWSWIERPGLLLLGTFLAAQLVISSPQSLQYNIHSSCFLIFLA